MSFRSRRFISGPHTATASAERLEDRRLLSVSYVTERHDLEGNRLGVYAEFTADARPDVARINYGDGTLADLWLEYDSATRSGWVSALHDFSASGNYAVNLSLQGGGTSDARSFNVEVSTSTGQATGTPTALYDSPSPFGPFDFGPSGATAVGTAPAISAVYVSGSAWTPAFKSYLASQGLGSSAYGFAVPDTDQLNELPWSNLNQVSLTFSEDVIVDQSHLLVVGSNVVSYGLSAFSYDEASLTATWTLSSVLAPNAASGEEVLLHLSNMVQDFDGERLDGEWANNGQGPDTFASGDGAAGGAFRFRFNVLPGDVNRNGVVNTVDTGEVQSRFFTSTTVPGNPPNTYSAFHDVNGSGHITADDFSAAKARYDAVFPATDPTPPAFSAAPSGLSAAPVSPSEILLSWSDNSADETGFLLEASLDGTTFGEVAIVGPGTTSFVSGQSLPNSPQHFRVAALNAAGHSAFSNTALTTTPPAAPDYLTVEQVTESQIDLSWPVVTGLSSYTLEWRQAGGGWTAINLGASTGTFSHTGRTEGKLYEYRLRAANSSGVSPYGPIESVYTLPGSPSGLTATESGNSVDLSWADMSQGESGFVVEGAAAGAEWREFLTVGANQTTASVAGLAAATPYSFRVFAYNESGDSAATPAVLVTTTGWLLSQEASVEAVPQGQKVTLGVADRAENSPDQLPGVHGAALLLAPAASYTISFTPDLHTWDSYSPGSGSGTGYWDSFSVSVDQLPYWQRTDLGSDPLSLPFIWGGANYDPGVGGTGKETYTTTRTITLPSADAAKPQYLSVVLDTNTLTEADEAYPSWGTFTITTTPLPVMPVVSVQPRRNRHQAAEGGSAAARGEFVFHREGGDASDDLQVDFTVGGTANEGQGGDFASIARTVTIPADSRSATVYVTGLADTVVESPETVVLTVTDVPDRYTRNPAGNNATITILDRKKYFVYFYGFTGPGNFGDDWLDKIGEVQQSCGYELLGNLMSGGFAEDSGEALPILMGALNADAADGRKFISRAEAESADIAVAGWSFGGTQAVNYVYDLSRAGDRVGEHRLEAAVQVRRLITLDPVTVAPFKVLRPFARVKDNVNTFRNFYQERKGISQFRNVDAQGNPGATRRSQAFRLDRSIAGRDIPTDLTSPRAVQIRIDTDNAADEERRDRIGALGAGDPLLVAGETGWRMFGRWANHNTVPWYAYRRVLDELL